jgi:hypothetical protein
MASMRDLMEMIEGANRVPYNPVEARQHMLDQLDQLLGNQVLTKIERAEIFDEIARTATRMSRGLRDAANR